MTEHLLRLRIPIDPMVEKARLLKPDKFITLDLATVGINPVDKSPELILTFKIDERQ